jgi:sterol desaturase/sphingolipid hydroxylase (fatty acid hydroxylase superfamily)
MIAASDIVPYRTLIAALCLVALWTLEGIAPMYPARRRRLIHDLNNLGLMAINFAVISLLFGALTVAVARYDFGLLHWVIWPAWAEVVVAIVLFDAWQYLWHLLNHQVAFLSRFHSVHHADAEMDASSALRFHPGEILLSSSARLIMLPLLGLSVAQLLLYETLLLPVILFHHSNVRVPPGIDRALRLVIPTPWMHWVHHSQIAAERNSNYSSLLSVWDRLFGTFRLRDKPAEIELGLPAYPEAEWRSVIGMLRAPFHRRPCRLKDTRSVPAIQCQSDE